MLGVYVAATSYRNESGFRMMTICRETIEEQFSGLTTRELIWNIRESQISLALNIYGRLSDEQVNDLYKRMDVAEQLILSRVGENT